MMSKRRGPSMQHTVTKMRHQLSPSVISLLVYINYQVTIRSPYMYTHQLFLGS